MSDYATQLAQSQAAASFQAQGRVSGPPAPSLEQFNKELEVLADTLLQMRERVNVCMDKVLGPVPMEAVSGGTGERSEPISLIGQIDDRIRTLRVRINQLEAATARIQSL